MTDDPQSLSERLREGAPTHYSTEINLRREAADALDAKDVEIAAWHSAVLAIVEAAGGLVDAYPTGKHNILQRIRTMRDALDAKDAEIALLKEGRKLHDEHADHLEHELAAQSALIAQAAAALESLTKDPPSSLASEPDTDCEVVLKMREIAREALAAIRAKEHP